MKEVDVIADKDKKATRVEKAAARAEKKPGRKRKRRKRKKKGYRAGERCRT